MKTKAQTARTWIKQGKVLLELNDPTLWYILTFLRSYDGKLRGNGNRVLLKGFTVGRVRAITGLSNGVDRVLGLSENERRLRNKLLKQTSHHFHTHWLNAVRAIITLYGYDLEHEEHIG